VTLWLTLWLNCKVRTHRSERCRPSTHCCLEENSTRCIPPGRTSQPVGMVRRERGGSARVSEPCVHQHCAHSEVCVIRAHTNAHGHARTLRGTQHVCLASTWSTRFRREQTNGDDVCLKMEWGKWHTRYFGGGARPHPPLGGFFMNREHGHPTERYSFCKHSVGATSD
jgi:hypothetical protein